MSVLRLDLELGAERARDLYSACILRHRHAPCTMASPPCCPADSTPVLDNSPPSVGQVVDVQNGESGAVVKTYVTGDDDVSSCSHIVLVFSDVFGYDSGRQFEFADHLSRLLNETNGVKAAVLVPDVFGGRPPFVEYRFLPQFLSGLVALPFFVYRVRIQGTNQFLSPIYDTLLPWLEKRGVDFKSTSTNLSWVGFCFGGWLGAKLTALSHDGNTNRSCDLSWSCGVGIHPALLPERVAGGSEEDLASSMRATPIKLMPAQNDPYHAGTNDKVVQILASSRSISEEEISISFDGVKHGFCSRGDSTNRAVQEAQTKAEALAASFILENANSDKVTK